jgi:ubiquitin-conjugating enzyme E2 J2
MSAAKRLQRELSAAAKETLFRVAPLEADICIFHYVLMGAPETPYEGGFYHGEIRFPRDYPLKPPGILMHTPSGRFEINTRLCFSMSDFHRELVHFFFLFFPSPESIRVLTFFP